MCTVCGQYPCHYNCPNCAPKKFGVCAQCGEKIYENMELWSDNDNNKFCSEECAKEYHGIKEI